MAEVEAGGMRFFYREWEGSGPTVVLWHGITSSSGSWWRVAPALAHHGFHVYTPDLPGHGMSGDSPSGYAVTTTAALLDACRARLDDEALRSAEAQAARDRAERLFSPDRVGERLMAAYHDALGHTSTPAEAAR